MALKEVDGEGFVLWRLFRPSSGQSEPLGVMRRNENENKNIAHEIRPGNSAVG